MPTASLNDIAEAPNTAHVEDIVEHPPSDLENFGKGIASKLSPLSIVKGTMDTAKAVYEHPIDTAMSVLAHPYFALGRAKDALMAGKIDEAHAHIQSAIDPTGFLTEDDMVKAATPGQRAEGFGGLVGTGLSALLTAKAPGLLKSGAAKALDALPETTAAEREAVGILSPRTKNVLAVAQRAKDVRNALAKTAEAPAPTPARATTAPPPAPVEPPPLPASSELQDFVKKLGFESYERAPEKVQQMADQAIQARSLTAKTPFPAESAEAPAPPVEAPISITPSKTVNQLIDEELAAKRAAAAPAPAAQVTPVSPLAAAPTVSEAPAAYLNQETSGLQIPQEVNARQAVGAKLAEHLKNAGITSGDVAAIKRAGPATEELFWDNLGQAHKPGYNPSPETRLVIERELAGPKPIGGTPTVAEPEPIPAALAKNPKALAIAKALRESMLQGDTLGDAMKSIGKR